MLKFYLVTVFFLFIILFAGCGATSTGSRYEDKKEEKADDKKETESKDFVEDFDLTPYKTEFDLEEIKIDKPAGKELEIWYDYELENEEETSDTSEAADTAPGFRVQVISTDNLEEAENIRSEIYFRTSQKNVYITFDPPFYKVKVGDFTSRSEAENLSFQLSQMGYNEVRVVNDSIIIK